MSKNFDETVRLQSEIRREVRGERPQGNAEAASSAAHQPRRSPGETSVRGPIVV